MAPSLLPALPKSKEQLSGNLLTQHGGTPARGGGGGTTNTSRAKPGPGVPGRYSPTGPLEGGGDGDDEELSPVAVWERRRKPRGTERGSGFGLGWVRGWAGVGAAHRL